MNMKLSDVAEKFFRWEQERGLFDREVCGVRYWHLFRFSIFNDFIVPELVGFGNAHPDAVAESEKTKLPLCSRIRRGVADLVDRLRFDPMFSNARADVLFALEPRQARMESGADISLMIDFFIDKMPSYAVLQYPISGKYVQMPEGRRVFRVSVCDGEERRLRRSFRRRNRSEFNAEAAFLVDEITGEFGVDTLPERVGGLLMSVLLRREVQYGRFRLWLRRLRTKCVVTSVHYNLSNLILAEAAHSLGLPVVELQHGTVFPGHVAYNLPPNGSIYRPDFFFAWGEFWKRGLRNYTRKSELCTGYPYFDHHVSACPRIKRNDGVVRVLFVSQGTIGGPLSEVAAEVARRLPAEEFRVFYKLHPSETRTWRGLYPALADPSIEVIENTGKNIYSCFAKCDVVVGVYSTAVVEALAWGLKVFSCRWMAGADGMRDFVDAGYVRYAESVDDLLRCVRSGCDGRNDAMDVSGLWVPGSAENIPLALKKVSCNGGVG